MPKRENNYFDVNFKNIINDTMLGCEKSLNKQCKQMQNKKGLLEVRVSFYVTMYFLDFAS